MGPFSNGWPAKDLKDGTCRRRERTNNQQHEIDMRRRLALLESDGVDGGLREGPWGLGISRQRAEDLVPVQDTKYQRCRCLKGGVCMGIHDV